MEGFYFELNYYLTGIFKIEVRPCYSDIICFINSGIRNLCMGFNY